jgi:hypothetical protein
VIIGRKMKKLLLGEKVEKMVGKVVEGFEGA